VEASRAALGGKNAMRVEVNGSEGSLAFDFEDMNHLQFFDGSDRTQLHPPGRGLAAIAAGRLAAPSFTDALQVQRVLAAVEESATSDSPWTAVL
jgi:predicted dehydrogenase